MLLRNAASQDRDLDIFHTMSSHNPAVSGGVADIPTAHPAGTGGNTNSNYDNNNSLDDVWGTASDYYDTDHHPPHHPPPHHHQQHHHHDPAARRLEAVLSEARRELGVAGVFDGQYWAPDGTWRYHEEADADAEAEVVFPDVAEAHPLLRKWSRIVRAEAARYGVDWEILKDDGVGDARVGRGREGEEEEEEGEAGEEHAREREGRVRRERAGQQPQPVVRGREALAW
ncbi:hypothetical protein VTH06DRAFT_4810 [Thermothelomyces fergusii]